jgi:hypothetical protein
VQINLGRIRTVAAVVGTMVFLVGVAGMVWVATDTTDGATRTVAIVFAVLAAIPLLRILFSFRRLTRPSVLGFDPAGISYAYDGQSTVVPWGDVTAVGIAFEVPAEIPSIDLSGILADKLVYDVLKVSKARKIALEIFPGSPDLLVRHAVLAPFRQDLQPWRPGLPSGVWRMAFPTPRMARRVARGPQTYAPQLYLGWFRRPWSGSIVGRRDRVPRT